MDWLLEEPVVERLLEDTLVDWLLVGDVFDDCVDWLLSGEVLEDPVD